MLYVQIGMVNLHKYNNIQESVFKSSVLKESLIYVFMCIKRWIEVYFLNVGYGLEQ